MINAAEIEAKAREFDIHHANVQRDYVFGWLLKGIYENEYLRHALVFKGGNCLRKAFYPNTRFSSDLDFAAPSAIDDARLIKEINAACEAAGLGCGVEFLIERNIFERGPQIDRERQSIKGRIYFMDFFGEQDNLTISVRLDVTEFDRLQLRPVSRSLIHPYSDAPDCHAALLCMALEEIVASKLKCLIQRRHSHDLFDLVYATFIDRSIELDRNLVLRTFLQKTIFGPSPGAAKEILLGLPMAFFGGVWERFIRCPKASRFGFDHAVAGFRDSIERLFHNVQIRPWGEPAFFPSAQRNLIMQAGAERRLIKLTYRSVEREVEPYSLAYKRPANVSPREYLYAYDRTGGKESGPGIKSFLSPGIERMQLTESTFEPRFEIELSKAGEEARKGYFGRSFSRMGENRGSRRPLRRVYKVECPYCQKRFVRSTPGTALRPHKDSAGYPCRARNGYRVNY